MVTCEPDGLVGAAMDRCAFKTLFEGLTRKQHEVFQLVAENRTSKEIAAQLGISESAVNQRIEAVRLRAGCRPRAQLARAYREFLAERHHSLDIHPAPAPSAVTGSEVPVVREGSRRLGGASVERLDLLIPTDRRLRRVATMVFIAAGLMTAAAASLAVAQVLTDWQ
jgi:DNA-binding CsgD family transcriptional regulator